MIKIRAILMGVDRMKTLRLEKIMGIIRRKGYATIEELAEELGVSKITVRRDLSFLESQGLVERKRGGAVLKSFKHEIPFFLKLEKKKDEKMRIGKRTVRLFDDGQTVFATGGTTVYYTVQALEESNVRDLTIITNSITTAWAVINLNKPVDLIHTGGSVRSGSFECIGAQVMKFVEDLNVDVFVMGIDGIDLESGVTFSNYEESMIAKRVLENSRIKIVVADDSKFGEVYPYKVADLKDLDYIVTNRSDFSTKFEDRLPDGVKLIFA